MKLNYKKTVFVGFAFFLIIVFWQAYDTIIPKILTDKFGMAHSLSGLIMALDNILALFLLPFFGALSDKTKSKMGKRTPYILIGTLLSVVMVMTLTVFDGMQAKNLENVAAEKGESGLVALYDASPEIQVTKGEDSLSGDAFFKEKKPLKELISKEEFTKIPMKNEDGSLHSDYTKYVVPARQAYASMVAKNHPTAFVGFTVVLIVLLLSMGIFRSPAVALMPDVTPKPLRSKGNAVINLMGAFGGIIVLGISMVFHTGKPENALMSYFFFFAVISLLMLLSLAIFMMTVKEKKWVAEAEKENCHLEEAKEQKKENFSQSGENSLTNGEIFPESGENNLKNKEKSLEKGEKRSLILILLSVALWYMGYNAIISKYSVYAGEVLGMDYSLPLMLAQGVAIFTYLPAGFLASKIGRKKSILIGVGLLAIAFFSASFVESTSPYPLVIFLFGLAGMGWATINVSSFPMVVELAGCTNIGKYTGYYYTASMAAQTVTPVLSGVFLDMNMRTFFPYATIFVSLSFVTMLFVKHGDSKPIPKKDFLENLETGE